MKEEDFFMFDTISPKSKNVLKKLGVNASRSDMGEASAKYIIEGTLDLLSPMHIHKLVHSEKEEIPALLSRLEEEFPDEDGGYHRFQPDYQSYLIKILERRMDIDV